MGLKLAPLRWLEIEPFFRNYQDIYTRQIELIQTPQ